jgi:large subunit ribosomal protein L25
MKSIEIKVDPRKSTGKKETAGLRRQGFIPCVMYGGNENIHFATKANDFRHVIYTHDVFLIILDIDGKKYHATLKEIQFHPVTDEVLHMDFIQVSEEKPAIVALPVTITGNSVGIMAGGKLRQRKRYLKAKGLIKDLPETLTIDISDLEIGKFIKVGDLKFDKIELLDPVRAMVIGVTTSRVAKGMELEEPTPAATVEETAEVPAEAPAEAPAKEK